MASKSWVTRYYELLEAQKQESRERWQYRGNLARKAGKVITTPFTATARAGYNAVARVTSDTYNVSGRVVKGAYHEVGFRGVLGGALGFMTFGPVGAVIGTLGGKYWDGVKQTANGAIESYGNARSYEALDPDAKTPEVKFSKVKKGIMRWPRNVKRSTCAFVTNTRNSALDFAANAYRYRQLTEAAEKLSTPQQRVTPEQVFSAIYAARQTTNPRAPSAARTSRSAGAQPARRTRTHASSPATPAYIIPPASARDTVTGNSENYSTSTFTMLPASARAQTPTTETPAPEGKTEENNRLEDFLL
jgi:hypothetical protein